MVPEGADPDVQTSDVDIGSADRTVTGMEEPWVIVLGAGRVPAELSGELGAIASGQPPVGGVPALMTMLKVAPTAKVFVVLDPTDTTLGDLVKIVRPDAEVVFQPPSGGVGAAFLATYDDLSDRHGTPGSGYVVYADTITNFPADTDVIAVGTAPERRWTTADREGETLRIIEKNSGAARKHALVGMFHFSDLAAFAGCVRAATKNAELDIFHQGLVRYDAEVHRLNLETAQRWLDVGHLDTYHDARRRALVARAFNQVHVREDAPEVLAKSGADTTKITQEADWYRSLPAKAAWLAPRFMGERDGGYEIEYIPGLLVAESYLYGDHDDAYWSRLLNTVHRALNTLHTDITAWDPAISSAARRSVWITKTRDRLIAARTAQPHLGGTIIIDGLPTPGIDTILEELDRVVSASALLDERPVTRIHGDLHPGNMLYDHRTGALKLVDPRGSFSIPGPYGDPLYDLAKLAHGFLGNYDALLFGCYRMGRTHADPGNHPDDIETKGAAYASPAYTIEFVIPGTGPAMFRSTFRSWLANVVETAPYRATISDVELGVALLFLSLAALHQEKPDRQEAFIVRGLQLWREARKPFVPSS